MPDASVESRSALTLTDDELAALAYESSREWPTELPTIRIDDVAQLRVAIERGRRSLLARELITLSRPTDDEVELSWAAGLERIRRLTQEWPHRTRMCLLDPAGALASFDLLSYGYPSDDGWLVESVDDGGSHRFVDVSQSELDELYVSLLELVAAEGVPGGHAGALCVAIGTPDGVAAAVIAVKGGLTLIQADDQGVRHQPCESAQNAWQIARRIIVESPTRKLPSSAG